MNESWFQPIKDLIRFSEADAAAVRSLKPVIAPRFGEIIAHFYDSLLEDPEAREVFIGGRVQMDKLRQTLTNWLAELFQGPYDEAYFRNRLMIGHTHVRVDLAARYMLAGMELVWGRIEHIVRSSDVADVDSKLSSVHKLLSLDLMIMIESFQESHAEKVRASERSAVEEKLTRAEHLAEIGQLAASLAHEIKNPLAGISGAIQIIRDSQPADDPHKPVITEILGQIKRLDATVKDLLQYARPTPPHRSEIPVDSLLAGVLQVLHEEPALQRIHVECEEEDGARTIYGDERQIEQLLMNLLINAAHASPVGGEVRVVVARSRNHVQLRVRDWGQGMTQEVGSRAFEPFYTTKAKGTGLGLSICRRIVEAHGGRIRLDSEPGAGTTVTVFLPDAKE